MCLCIFRFPTDGRPHNVDESSRKSEYADFETNLERHPSWFEFTVWTAVISMSLTNNIKAKTVETVSVKSQLCSALQESSRLITVAHWIGTSRLLCRARLQLLNRVSAGLWCESSSSTCPHAERSISFYFTPEKR